MQARRSPARKRAVKAHPLRVGLQLARLVPSAPESDAWLHEVKFDGYRILLWRNGREVRITSRGNQDWSMKLPTAAETTRGLPCRNCILEGELVALDEDGRSSFARLQQFFGEGASRTSLRITVFDLLFLDGQDLPSRQQLRGAVPVWARPELVVEVEFRGYTQDGLLRQTSLKGLRRDRSVESLRPAREVAVITSGGG